MSTTVPSPKMYPIAGSVAEPFESCTVLSCAPPTHRPLANFASTNSIAAVSPASDVHFPPPFFDGPVRRKAPPSESSTSEPDVGSQ